MKLLELYNLKLNEYKKTGFKDKPSKLLALLLLATKDEYVPLKDSIGIFYKIHKSKIDSKLFQVEKDFNFSKEEIMEYIEKVEACDDYENQKIWIAFEDGISALQWGLLYRQDKTGEEIYSEYFESNELKKEYDLEQLAISNKISVSDINKLIDKILQNPKEFYEKICELLTFEERNFIIKMLKDKSCQNCQNVSCKVKNSDKISLDENNQPLSFNCLDWYNAEQIGRSKLSRKRYIYKL